MGDNIVVARHPTPKQSPAPRKAYPIFKRESIPRVMKSESRAPEVIELDGEELGDDIVVASRKRQSPDLEIVAPSRMAKKPRLDVERVAPVLPGIPARSAVAPPRPLQPVKTQPKPAAKPFPHAEVIMLDDSDDDTKPPMPFVPISRPQVKTMAAERKPAGQPVNNAGGIAPAAIMTPRPPIHARATDRKLTGAFAMDLDAKPPSTPTPRLQVTTAAAPRKAAGPFMIDDDDSDDEAKTSKPSPVIIKAAPKPVPRVTDPTAVAAEKEAQRLASARLRDHALERKAGISTPSSSRSFESAVEVQTPIRPSNGGRGEKHTSMHAADTVKPTSNEATQPPISRTPVPALAPSGPMQRHLGNCTTTGIRPAVVRPENSRLQLEAEIAQMKAQDASSRQFQQVQRDAVSRREDDRRAREFRERDAALAALAKAQSDTAKQAERTRHMDELRRRREEVARKEKEARELREVDANIEAEANLHSEQTKEMDVEAKRQQLFRNEQEFKRRLAKEQEARERASRREAEVRRAKEADVRRAEEAEEARRKRQQIHENVERKLAERASAAPVVVRAPGGGAVGPPMTPAITHASGDRGDDGDAERLRQERVRAKEQRNARNRPDAEEHDIYDVPPLEERDPEDVRRETLFAMRDRHARNRANADEHDIRDTPPKTLPIMTDTSACNRRAPEQQRRSRDEERGFAGLPVTPKTGGHLSPRSVAAPAPIARSTAPDTFAPLPMTPKVPVSLSSAAGLAAVSGMNNPFAGPAMASTRYQDDTRITSRDVKLINLKRAGLTWDQIPPAYAEETGHRQDRKSLNTRWTTLKTLLASVDPSTGHSDFFLDLDGEYANVTFDQLKRWVQDGTFRSVDGYTTMLGEITVDDVKMLKWRLAAKTLDEVTLLYHRNTGTKRSNKAISARLKMLTAAFRGRKFDDPQMIDKVAAGDGAAKARLNELLEDALSIPPAPTDSPAADRTSMKSREPGRVGEIMSTDIIVLKWRKTGMIWPLITTRYLELTGEKRAKETLRKRNELVETAIEQHSVDQDLVARAADNDEEARQELNRLVHGTWPVPKSTVQRPAGPINLSLKLDQNSGTGYGARFNTSFDNSSATASWAARSNGSQRADSPIATDRRLDGRSGEERPTEGGKTVNAEMLKYTLAGATSVWEDIEAEDAEPEMDEATVEEDLNHFTYNVQRREIRQADIDEDPDLELDQLQWVNCGYPSTNRDEANAESRRQLGMSNNMATKIAMARGGTLERGEDDDGLAYGTHTMKDAGTIEVRVVREMRTHSDGVQLKVDEACLAAADLLRQRAHLPDRSPSRDRSHR